MEKQAVVVRGEEEEEGVSDCELPTTPLHIVCGGSGIGGLPPLCVRAMHLSLDTTNQEREETYDKETLPPSHTAGVCATHMYVCCIFLSKKYRAEPTLVKGMINALNCKTSCDILFYKNKKKQMTDVCGTVSVHVRMGKICTSQKWPSRRTIRAVCHYLGLLVTFFFRLVHVWWTEEGAARPFREEMGASPSPVGRGEEP